MRRKFPSKLGLHAEQYPDITDDYEQLKLSLYDQLVRQGSNVAPVVINGLFAENGAFDTRGLKQFPDPGEFARLNGQVITPDEINHRLYGLALGASGNQDIPEARPAYLNRSNWVNTGVSQFNQIVPKVDWQSPGVIYEREELDPDDVMNVGGPVLHGGISTGGDLPGGGGVGKTIALSVIALAAGLGLKALLGKKSRDHDNISRDSMPDDTALTWMPRLPIEGPRGAITPSQLSARIEQAWQQFQNPNAPISVPKPQTTRATWGQPIQGPPRFMAENTVTDMPDPDLSLPVQPQAPRADVQQARLQQWQRLQAAQDQVNSIYQPPASNIMGGQLRQTILQSDMDQWLNGLRERELQRLQIEQLKQQQQSQLRQKGKPVYQPTEEQAKAIEEDFKSLPPGFPDATYTLDVVALIYGVKEVQELLRILTVMRVPIQVFAGTFKQQLKKALTETLKTLSKNPKAYSGTIFYGPPGIRLQSYQHFKRILDKNGVNALMKAKRNLEKRLAEHWAKIEKYKNTGHTSSMEKEVRNFTDDLKAIDYLLKGNM
jgi:hypothetical protein